MSNSSDPSGVKRKRDDGKPAKFYGVRIGRQPGVYHSWNDCLKQVEGHKNASCMCNHLVNLTYTDDLQTSLSPP